MGTTWGPSGADRTQVGPMLAPWTMLSIWEVIIYGTVFTLTLWGRLHIKMPSYKDRDYHYGDNAGLSLYGNLYTWKDVFVLKRGPELFGRNEPLDVMPDSWWSILLDLRMKLAIKVTRRIFHRGHTSLRIRLMICSTEDTYPLTESPWRADECVFISTGIKYD